jgi:hypothetical protein
MKYCLSKEELLELAHEIVTEIGTWAVDYVLMDVIDAYLKKKEEEE